MCDKVSMIRNSDLARVTGPGGCHHGRVTSHLRPPAPRRARGRLWTTLVLAWAVAVAALGYLAYRHGTPTDREQTGLSAALPTVERALADVAGAAGVAGVAGAVEGPEVAVVLADPAGRASGCQITPIRTGVRYQRSLDLYVAPAGSAELLTRIAQRLPGPVQRRGHRRRGHVRTGR